MGPNGTSMEMRSAFKRRTALSYVNSVRVTRGVASVYLRIYPM